LAIQIRNLAGVDEVKEQWQLTGRLIFRWKGGKAAWRPRVSLVNEVTPAAIRDVEVYAERDGTMVVLQDLNATLSTDLDLTRFPFDAQNLPIVVEPVGMDADRTVLRFDSALSSVSRERYAELAQWKPVSLTARTYDDMAPERVIHGLAVGLHVKRNSTSYLWKFIVPLVLLVIISWVTFWLSPEVFTAKEQLATAVSTLLIIVAFTFVSSGLVPRTSYMTYLDALLFVSFVFVVVSIGFIVASHLLDVRFKAPVRALLVRQTAGVALPVLFFAAQAALLVWFKL